MRASTGLGIAMIIGMVWVLVDGAKRLQRPVATPPAATAGELPAALAAPPPRAARQVPKPAGATVVLPGSMAPDVVSQCSRWPPAIEGGWDVPAPVVAQLDADFPRIAGLAADRCCDDGARIADPAAFHRQLVGVVMDGRQLVYVNAVGTTAPDPAWRSEPVRVCDGGAAFWGVLYDPETRAFSDLAVNGRR